MKECKNLKEQEIQNVFIKTIYTKPTFNTIWFMEIFKDLPRGKASDKAFNNDNFDNGYQSVINSMV